VAVRSIQNSEGNNEARCRLQAAPTASLRACAINHSHTGCTSTSSYIRVAWKRRKDPSSSKASLLCVRRTVEYLQLDRRAQSRRSTQRAKSPQSIDREQPNCQSLGNKQGGAMKVTVVKWHGVANWRWEVDDDCCGICRCVRNHTDRVGGVLLGLHYPATDD
jgi:hypothetical protein